jgi:adenylate cyclase class 2
VLEVEMKFRSPGNDEVVANLQRLGAEQLSEEDAKDTYYMHPSRQFKDTDEALRLRIRGRVAELTYKGPRMASSSAKAREELTVNIDDTLSLKRILERLGFVELTTVSKRRISFALDKLRVDVDDVEGLGQFVELELMTEDPFRAERLIGEAREGLCLGKAIEETYLELILRGRQ